MDKPDDKIQQQRLSYLDSMRTLHAAIVILAETRYTPEELVRWSAENPFHEHLDLAAYQASWFTSKVSEKEQHRRKQQERLEQRLRRSQKETAPIERPTEKPEVVN